MPAVIMSGRDCIGIAKTGSGKTLAFVLPMLRHVKDQPPLAQGDGPVALSMAPTRELVVQVCRVMAACVVLRQFAVWRAGLVVTEICPPDCNQPCACWRSLWPWCSSLHARQNQVRCHWQGVAPDLPALRPLPDPFSLPLPLSSHAADQQGGQALCQGGGADLRGRLRRLRRGEPDH